MAIQQPVNFSSAQTMSHSHNRQTSVASFASSLYLPVDPDNQTSLDDEADTYPSSDELFGLDHEEGDDYTISSRRHLSYSRYSSVFSHPPTPPRSTRSTMSLERSSSSLSLASPHRHGNTDAFNSSPSAWANRPAVIRTVATHSTTELPSPPSTARSSNDTAMSASQAADQGVPIEKFEQLALEHLEQDRALLAMLQKLDEQKGRISQLTYALSRLRVLSNSACLLPPDSDAPISTSAPAIQSRRLGAVIPKPLIVQQSTKSATSSVISGTGLSGPSQNEAVNQRRRAKQQLHEFALRRPTRTAPKSRLGGKPVADNVKRRGWEWEGTRGSSSMVATETKSRAANVAAVGVGHPNITIRRPKRPEVAVQLSKSPARPPRPSIATSLNPETPPRLASLFASPNRTPTQSRLSVHDSPNTQSRLSAVFDAANTPVPPRKFKDKPLPLLPPGRPRNVSYTYEIPPVPSPDHTTAHVTLLDTSRTTPPLPADEIQNRLAATFAHFSHQTSPSRQGMDVGPEESLGPMNRREPDYLQEMLQRKWVTQLDEHAHQARGSWKSPLKSIRQRLVGGFGGGRKSSRASVSMSSSEDHSTSLDTPGYIHGLDTLQEGEDGIDSRTRKLRRKAGKDKDEVPSTPKATKSSWRFSRLASSSS